MGNAEGKPQKADKKLKKDKKKKGSKDEPEEDDLSQVYHKDEPIDKYYKLGEMLGE